MPSLAENRFKEVAVAVVMAVSGNLRHGCQVIVLKIVRGWSTFWGFVHNNTLFLTVRNYGN